jgi:dTMP kinase
MRGKFITFEGGEGAGKSTQAEALARRLQSLGIDVRLTREPGGSPGAEIIRHVLLAGGAKPFGADTEAILFAAARDDHVRSTIEPALARGSWVISDRFADSTRVYQGALGKVDTRLLNALERVTIGDLKPDLTILLDLPAEMGLFRANKRRGKKTADRFEGEGKAFHEKLRDAYQRLAAGEPERCAVVDARASQSHVASRVWDVVDERLKPRSAQKVAEGVAS